MSLTLDNDLTAYVIHRELLKCETFKHYRVNVVNGCDNLVRSYNKTLEDLISVNDFSFRNYRNITDLDSDLFSRLDELNSNWFNLFIFNVNNCSNGCQTQACKYYNCNGSKCSKPYKCYYDEIDNSTNSLHSQLSTINHTIKWTHDNMNMDNYSYVIVSSLEESFVKHILKSVNNCMKSVDMIKFINYDCIKEELYKTIYYSIKSRSTKQKEEWHRALQGIRAALI